MAEPKPDTDFLAGGGEMGERIRALDWASTPLGPIVEWPQSMRLAVGLCVKSRFPIIIHWGWPDFTVLYNDAFLPFAGEKHPKLLGRPLFESWPELRLTLGPMLESVLTTGKAALSDDLLLVYDRSGYLEETYYTLSFNPIVLESGKVGGSFSLIDYTTDRVIGERRLRTLRDLAARTGEAKQTEEACRIAAEVLGANSRDISFALIYLLEPDRRRARLVATTGLDAGGAASPPIVDLTAQEQSPSAWPLARVTSSTKAERVNALEEKFGPLPGGAWLVPSQSALVLPITLPGHGSPSGLLVAALSPRKALDDAYRTFFDLVTAQIAASLVGVAAYQGLVELDQAKTAFFSNVSHEFRTPLTLLLGPLQQVVNREENPLGAADREVLKVAQRNALRLQKLVNSLLDFSRIEAGRMQAVYESTDLAALASDLAGSFRSAIERAGMRLLVDCPPLAAPVYVDREMWEKIVLNLLSNAFKYTFQGEIRVSLRQTEGAVEFSVGDTGVGIPETDLPRLFERFHRVESVRGRTMEGTGIGLALVQELVKLHGGSIRVTSNPGRGSTFTISVPLGKDHLPVDRVGGVRSLGSTATGATPFLEEALRWLPSEAMEEASALRSRPTAEITPFPSDSLLEREGLAGKARILLADDNADMRDYVRRLLNEQYEVTTVEDGEAALAAIHRSPPDLVLTDVMMPGLDGFGLLKAIRSDAKTSAIPVIILSARAGEDSKVEGLERGADDYLVKPFSARELTARVAAHVTMAELRKEVAERKAQAAKAAELAKMNKALRAEVTERKRLEQELKYQRDRLGLVLDLNNRVVSNLDLRQLFQVFSTELRRIMECDFVGLALPESGGKQLRQHMFEHSQGQGSMYEGRLIPVEGSPSGVAFRNAKPFILQSAEQAREDLEIYGETGGEAFDHRVLAEGFQSGCFLPLISRNRVLGVLQLTRQEAHAFDQQDVDFLGQIASQIAIAVDNALNYKQLTEARARLVEEKLYLEEEIQKEYNFEEIVGNSPSLLQLLEQVALAAPTDSSVLISGETGTGKELIARAIHAHGSRKDSPLVKVNCGSIPAGLVESELFGHVKGAFTGATSNRTGRFELAHGGTLFLDEVGELPLDTQVKLLRVLQEQEFEPVGGSRTIHVDVRIIAATNRNLEEAVRSGLFRSDLYYRLNVLPLRVPPLRERRSDIPQIVTYFLNHFSKKIGRNIRGVSPETMQLLVNYSWPGNIRELQNIIERGVVLSHGPALTLEPNFLPLERSHPSLLATEDHGHQGIDTRALVAEASLPIIPSLEEVEKCHILQVLKRTGGVISGAAGAAALLKMHPNTLRSRMKKLGIARQRHDIS